MKPLLDAFAVWLVLAAGHWPRVLGVALFVFAWIGFCGGDTGDWLATLKSAAFGLFFGVLFVFGAQIGNAHEG
jgi:hypothetical protein